MCISVYVCILYTHTVHICIDVLSLNNKTCLYLRKGYCTSAIKGSGNIHLLILLVMKVHKDLLHLISHLFSRGAAAEMNKLLLSCHVFPVLHATPLVCGYLKGRTSLNISYPEVAFLNISYPEVSFRNETVAELQILSPTCVRARLKQNINRGPRGDVSAFAMLCRNCLLAVL